MLQRKVQNLEDANGVAQALADAKNQVQGAQREMKRAQITERVARKALDAFHDTRNMPQDSVANQDEVEKVRQEEDEREELGELQVDLETCKGLPDKAPGSRGDTSTNRVDCERALQKLKDEYEERRRAESKKPNAAIKELEERLQDEQDRFEELNIGFQELKEEAGKTKDELERVRSRNAKLEDELCDINDSFDNRIEVAEETANTTIAEKQTELQDFKARLAETRIELQQLEAEVSDAKADLASAHAENAELEKDLKDEKYLNTHLIDINDGLLADLATKEAEHKALAREHDDLKVHLTETLLALNESEKSEAEACNELAILQAGAELTAYSWSQQNVAFQVDVDTLSAQVDEHEHDMAVKDKRIEKLVRDVEASKSKLEEMQARNTVDQSIDCPIAHREFSTANTLSMQAEFGTLSEVDFDDDRSIYDHSDGEDSATEPVNLELATVHEIISIAPQDVAAPRLTVSVVEAIATTPRRQDSFIECSPVSSVSSTEPAQPATLRLAICNNIIADFAPSEPEAPAMSLSGETVKCVSLNEPRSAPLAFSNISEALDYAPAEPAISPSESPAPILSLSKNTVEVVSPFEPRVAPLALFNVQTAYEYAPAGPTVSTPTAIAESQKPSLRVDEVLNYSPIELSTPPLLAAAESQTLTLDIFEYAVVNLNPDSGSVSVTDPHAHQVTAKSNRIGSKAVYKGKRSEGRNSKCFDSLWEQHSLPRPSLNRSRSKDLGSASEITASSLHRRSPIDAFAGLPGPSGTVDLDEVLATWPLEDETKDESTTLQCSTSTLTTPPLPAMLISQTPISSMPVSTPSSAPITPSAILVVQGKKLGAKHVLSHLTREGLNSFDHYMVHLLMASIVAFLAWRWWVVGNKLWHWEHADGGDFGEGYGGNVYDRYGPYGNGHVLLGMLPLNLLSADSLLPVKAVEVITGTVSAFEGLIGLGPGPTILY